MAEDIEWTVMIPGTPRPQGKLETGRGFKAHYPPLTKEHRVRAEFHMAQAWDGPPIEKGVAVAVDIACGFSRPASQYGTGRNSGMLKQSAPLLFTKAPDADKLARLILDALTNSGVLHDDAQVCLLRLEKRWIDQAALPYTAVTVRTVDVRRHRG